MHYSLKNIATLKRLLWADFILGFTTALIGLIITNILSNIFGLTFNLLLLIFAITLSYSIVAFILIQQINISILLLRILVSANWVWTIISAVLLFLHFESASIYGRGFLVLQILVVGALAYFEGNQIIKRN